MKDAWIQTKIAANIHTQGKVDSDSVGIRYSAFQSTLSSSIVSYRIVSYVTFVSMRLSKFLVF